ncbi:hypothetical protein ACFO8Q_01230 [Effusibacillus consociatus]|uniref:Uncharacterized protein n=1 Tax=Effusibacillus consociatus TaxID=1117041 RepID=A0ABV9Q004_9BACL
MFPSNNFVLTRNAIENILAGRLTEYSLGMDSRDIHAAATMLQPERQFFAPDARWISIASALEKGYFMLIPMRDQNGSQQPLKNEQIKQLEESLENGDQECKIGGRGYLQ